MKFKSIPKEYRPIPFWSWNEKLDVVETENQIQMMHQVGLGGFFMHARGGLQTEYMGEEWFENVKAAAEKAKELGMRPWAYDENGWPSGFGNSLVNGLGVEYQQKYLCMEVKSEHKETAICKCGNHYFYYEINPYYVDVLNEQVVRTFIELIYQPYYEKLGNCIEGFFTDEPQISRTGIPWSFVFEAEYKRRYNENILEYLEQLFLPVGDYKRTRVKFWKMVTELFSESYFKQIYVWCEEHDLKLTGHLLMEESLQSQLFTNGACMPHYEYMHIPGMDWLGRDIKECLTARQVSSVAEQLGKEAVLSETFALCGHNVSFAELKGIYEWQMVRGINLLCQHLQGYSIRGMRKRDYPPAMYIQQPWWSEYDKFIESMSRIGMILNEGKHEVSVLLLHPQTTAWSLYDAKQNNGLNELNDAFMKVIKKLEENHIEFHLGDEIIMERHAKVEDGKLLIGKQKYSYVINPCCETLLVSTENLLDKFKNMGGMVINIAECNTDFIKLLPNSHVASCPDITYTKRSFDNFTIHYFVNSSDKRETAKIVVNGKRLDIYTGELYPFIGVHEFEPWGSLVIVEENEAEHVNMLVEIPGKNLIEPKGIFRVVESTLNTLTLDKCDYYFDDELQERNGYVLNICERANELGRAVKIHQDYHVKIDYIPQELFLVCERPDLFRICINGIEIEKEVSGWFVDKSFKKIEISKYLKYAENVISFECDFKQSADVYQNLKKAKKHESERNKLVYDTEIEAIYLLGDFSVRTDGVWTKLENTGMRYAGEFVVDAPKKELDIKHIEKQGYPFFSGQITLEGEVNIEGDNPILNIDWKGINALIVNLNNVEKVMLTNGQLPLSDFDITGSASIKFTLINNLRNLLGPHHLEEGESRAVRPASFYKEPCVWNKGFYKEWNEEYCFVEFGI